MAQKPFTYAVLIGRFQPFHIGHEAVLKRALDRAEHAIVLIGSANRSVSYKNPFDFDQRSKMIERTFHYEWSLGRISIAPLDDGPSDDRWASDVRTLVTTIIDANRSTKQAYGTKYTVAITGFEKDKSSAYLEWFPEWEQDFVDVQYGTFSSTDIREAFFQRMPIIPHDACPAPVVEQLVGFVLLPQFKQVLNEREFLDAYKQSWKLAPFAPIFVTADAVVEQNKQVLLVRRAGQPGQGLLALPGGFIDVGERIRESVIRELREETQIADKRGRLPAPRLGNFIRDDKTTVFDDPGRSQRGRTITHAFLFDLPDGEEQYRVKGGDDASQAQWYPIGPNLDPKDFFEDHYNILSHFFQL